MMTVLNQVGRLCEALLVPPFTLEEARDLAPKLRKLVTGIGKSVVICADMRQVQVFPPDVAELITDMMKADNPRLERSALLIRDSSVFGLQMERMIRDAGNPSRRAFRMRVQLEKWLGEVLDPDEKARLKKFLDEHDLPAS
jgi:hypothetical protein